jgi:stage II sporulation protein D
MTKAHKMSRRNSAYNLIILLVLMSCSAGSSWPSEKLPETVRLLIGTCSKPFSVAGSHVKLTCLDIPDRPVYCTGTTLAVQRKQHGIAINGKFISGQTFRLESPGKSLKIDGSSYGGSIIIDCSRSTDVMLINEIDLEQYLEGLISIELSPRWELAAMKVQAVVARTYALCQKSSNPNNPYHLTTSVLHQLYRGIEHANLKTRQAVKETRGEVLTYGGAPIMAVYHSCCGGRTEDAENVWESDRDRPYLKSVFCGACTGYDKYFWKLTIPRETFYRKIGQAGNAAEADHETFAASRRSASNRVLEVTIQGKKRCKSLTSNEFRSLFGFSEMRSTNFIIRETDNGYMQFLGIGNGHGVGLCQWGARYRALRGETYREILLHYYPGTKLVKWY